MGASRPAVGSRVGAFRGRVVPRRLPATCSTAARVARRCVQRLAVRGWGVGVEGGEAEFGPGIEQPSVAGGGGEVLLS